MKDTPTKSGFIPYYVEDGQIEFMFMIPSDPKYGGDLPGIAKGGIDPGENLKEAGIREAEEELGLKKSNIKGKTVKHVWTGKIKGSSDSYIMSVFAGEVKSKKDFDKPCYETKEIQWMTAEEFKRDGRKSQAKIVSETFRLLFE